MVIRAKGHQRARCSQTMEFLTFIGLMAGLITTSSFVPQIIKGYRTGSMGDVSLTMPLLLMIGLTLWLIYGIYLRDLPIVLWNGVAIGLNCMIVLLKIRYGIKKEIKMGA